MVRDGRDIFWVRKAAVSNNGQHGSVSEIFGCQIKSPMANGPRVGHEWEEKDGKDR